jgi:hypothetical protein
MKIEWENNHGMIQLKHEPSITLSGPWKKTSLFAATWKAPYFWDSGTPIALNNQLCECLGEGSIGI